MPVHRPLALLLVVLAPSEFARGQTLYQAASNPIGAGIHPLVLPDAPDVIFDDVIVDPSQNPDLVNQFRITRVTVEIVRGVGAPATDLTLWGAGYTDVMGGLPLFADTTGIATISLAANAAPTPTIQSVTFGDGVSTLYIATGTFQFIPDFATFAMGLKFSDPSPLNGWSIVSGTEVGFNDPQYFGGFNTISQANSYFSFGKLDSTFALTIEGEPIPAPAAWTIGLVAVLGSRRRRS